MRPPLRLALLYPGDRAMGIDARHLDGGIEAWRAANLAVQPIDA
jgi:hypothetical protein